MHFAHFCWHNGIAKNSGGYKNRDWSSLKGACICPVAICKSIHDPCQSVSQHIPETTCLQSKTVEKQDCQYNKVNGKPLVGSLTFSLKRLDPTQESKKHLAMQGTTHSAEAPSTQDGSSGVAQNGACPWIPGCRLLAPLSSFTGSRHMTSKNTEVVRCLVSRAHSIWRKTCYLHRHPKKYNLSKQNIIQPP